MTDPIHVGVVGGHRLPGNVRTFLENIQRLLASRPTEFNCDLILRDEITPPEEYRQVDPGIGTPDTARAKLIDLVRALRQYVREYRPDVLFQVTRFPTHGAATSTAGQLTGTRTLTRMAGMSFVEHHFATGPGEKLKMFALKNCIGLAPVYLSDDIIVLGPNGRQALARRGRSRSIHEIPQPVDTQRFHPVPEEERYRIRDELGMPDPDDKRVLLTVGRVSRRKGILDLRETARELAAEDDPVQWYVVGDGPLVESLEGTSLVNVVGRIEYERMPDYFRAADLYVHPSLHEGLPNVLLEATACGTPSVARDVGECSLVATATFEDRRELPNLLKRSYESVELDERFEDEYLAQEYENILTLG